MARKSLNLNKIDILLTFKLYKIKNRTKCNHPLVFTSVDVQGQQQKIEDANKGFYCL